MLLDSIESSLSLESDHMAMNGIWFSHIFLNFDCCTKCTNCLVVLMCVVEYIDIGVCYLVIICMLI